MELERYGVTVNAIAPVAKTRLLATAGASLELDAGYDPLDPRNVAPFVVWLGSEQSGFVNGRVFTVVGGYVGICEGWRIGASLQVDGQLTFGLIEAGFPAEFAKARTNFPVRESHPYARPRAEATSGA
jgi:hypothetical protein